MMNIKNCLFYILVVLAIFFQSCQAKKKAVEKQEKAVTWEYDISRKENATLNTNVLTTKRANKTFYEPVNPSLPIIIDGKEYRNTRVIIEQLDEVTNDQSKAVTETQEKDQTKIEQTEDKKKTDSLRLGLPGWSITLIYIVLGLGGLALLFYYLKRSF